ncbi:hypothetical protein K9M74_00070 [Candidatus Woesearchaeota archaeon]|nr:hypothetical protein [Candidatus Woesearchaeota archaeon]
MTRRWKNPRYMRATRLSGEDIIRELKKGKRITEIKETELMNLETYVRHHLNKHPLSSNTIKIHTRVYLNTFDELTNLSKKEQDKQHIYYENGIARVAHNKFEGEAEYLERALESIFGWHKKSLNTTYTSQQPVNIEETFSKLFNFVMKYNFPLLFEQAEHPYSQDKYINLINGFNIQTFRAQEFKILEK